MSFKYPDATEYVLENISFTEGKGETIAVIGSTGSGKSTLLNLIPRFYDATEGKILIDDIDIKDYTLSHLHDKLGYVSQKAVIFRGTINYNIAYGNKENYKITKDKIKESSNKYISGSLAIALAIDILCFCPPETLVPPLDISESYAFSIFSINSFAHATLDDSFILSLVIL